jgi:RHS repeat-associated protein
MNCWRTISILCICLCFGNFAYSQVTTGTPPFGSFGGGPFDTVNLATLNTHFSIPIFTKVGRGIPFVFYVSNDSSVWYPVTSGSTTSWQYVSNWGWQAQGNTAVGYVTATSKPGYCFDLSTQPPTQVGTTVYTYKSYNDGRGTTHSLPANSVLTDLAPCNRQPAVPPSFTSNDGSGYTITTQAGDPLVTVTPRGGGAMVVPAIFGSGQGRNATNSTDSNGNYISYDGTTFTDTLGKQVLTISGTNPVLYTYTNPTGTTSHVSVSYTTYQIKTAFACSTVQDVTVPNVPLITQIAFPDNSSYSFTYEQTPNNAGYYTGRILSATLPTGGTIQYQYTGSNGGIECADGSAAGLTRTLIPAGSQSGDQWTYARTITTPPASNTTVGDPHGNQSSYDFQGIYETRRQIYNSTSVLQKKIVSCYDVNVAPANCPTTAVTLPITHRIVYNYFPDENGLLAKISDTFDPSFGMVTNHSDTGWSNDQRSVDILWVAGQNSSGAITERPGTVTSSYNSVIQGKTVYTYSDTVTATSGTPQHGTVVCTVAGCRGNASSIAYTTQGSSTVTRSFTYYDTGNVRTSTDVNGAVTTYSYGTGSCGNSLVTGTSVNTTPALTRSMTWDSTCNGGVLTSLTDENSKTTTLQFNDLNFWRETGIQDALSNTTTFSNSPTSQEQSLLFNSNQSVADILTTLDSFGRVSLVQQKQAPASSSYDSIQNVYDLANSLLKTSSPYVGAQGAAMPSGTPLSTAQYDALGRLTQIVDAGGGTANSSYYQNDILTSVVAPTGESNKQRQLEYDGLGRLASACEMTSGYTGAPSGNCAQHLAQTGYWTQYTYNTGGEVTSVTQNSQAGASARQTRTYTYDMLGRITSETNPEWNDFSHQYSYAYTYDTDTTCGTSNGDMVKRVDAEGTVTCYGYDKLHRLTSVTYPSGTYSNTTRKCFVYDSATVNGQSMANAKSRLAEAYTTSGTCASSKVTDIGFSYNGRGDLTDVYQSTPHSGGYYHVSAAYWANGALQSLSGLSGMPTFSFGVDGEGRISSVTAPPGYGQSPVTGTTYDTTNHKATATFGSSDSDVFTFDAATGRLSKYQYNVNAQTVTGNLSWNSNGTLQSLGITDPLNSQDAQNCTYIYDDLSRLGSANCGASIWSQTFAYDAFGNIQKSVPTGSTGVTFQPTYSSTLYPAATNRFLTLPGATPSYDKNGNVKADGTHNYTWDGEGNMLTLDTTGVTLTYDALGRMVEQNRGGIYTEIVYAPTGTKFALMNGQTLAKAFVPLPMGATAVYTSWSSGPSYYRHADWLGSSRLATKPDRTLYYDVAYAPFGENYNGKTGTGGAADLSYTGQDQDTASGLYDFLFRENNPVHGRWMSPDPAGLAAVNLNNPQTLNRYSYVGNISTTLRDPLGLMNDCGGICVPFSVNIGGGCAMTVDYYWMTGSDGIDYQIPDFGFNCVTPGDNAPQSTGNDPRGGGNGAANNGQPKPCTAEGSAHPSMGVSLSAATVNPFTSGGGGVWGANQQSFGVTTNDYTYSGTGAGLDVGVSVQSVWAWGSGGWGGPFNSVNFSAGVFGGSIFWTPGKGGWTGLSFGLSAGLPGAAYETTNYKCISGEKP